MEDKIYIQRCDGINFYRKKKEKKYTKMVSFKYSEDKIEKLKQIACNKNTRYQTLIKNTLDDLIKKESE